MTDDNEQENLPKPPPLPGQIYIRPGIDDRPDLDKALTPEDKSAIARLAVHIEREQPSDSAERAETQAVRMSDAGSPAVATAVPPTPIADASSAFLDMRDPMVAADGTKPDKAQIKRLNAGFTLAAVLRTLPWAMLNMVALPAIIDRLFGNPLHAGHVTQMSVEAARVAGAAPAPWLALVVIVGAIVGLVANVVVGVMSDHTRTPHGRRTPWIIAGGLLSALFTLPLGALGNVGAILFFWILLQITYAMLAAPLAAAFGERYPDKFREHAMRWRGIGLMLGQLLGVALGAGGLVLGGELPFAATAVVFVLAAVVPVLVWPKEPSSEWIANVKYSTEPAFAQMKLPSGDDNASFRRAYVARIFMMAGVGVMTVFQWLIVRHYVLAEWYLDARSAAQSSPQIWATCIAMLMIAVGAAVGAACAAGCAGRFGEWCEVKNVPSRVVVIAACVVYAAAIVLPVALALFLSTPVIDAGLFVYGIVSGFAFGLYDVFNQDVVAATIPDPRDNARYLNAFNVASVIGTVVAGCLGVVAVLSLGYIALLVAAIVVVLVGAALTPKD
ncbi:MFS transporter [Bifidobacterium biavatii]|uniref:Putative transmembrane protein n=1 Tax=Bifidobacterium biavatii DSM 23969 TaxID=1437608 RepID=A0A086ZNI6_9BIFI|nr:MFS transporter [Bifidobacterium biavatii]KFI48086.1 putative transmembrane protein [Bifidobacterium biavatii DSM 23969]